MTYKIPIICGLAITAGWLLRVILTGSFFYDFIIGNICLAAVPLLVEPLFRTAKRLKGLAAKLTTFAVSVIWLLFLPNAFYILTDLMHLNPSVLVNARDHTVYHSAHYVRGDALYVYDSLFLLAATALGAYLGGLALLHAYNYFRRRSSSLSATIVTASVMLLSAIGVYLGRLGRWNSWDAFIDPWAIVADLLRVLSNPPTRGQFFLFVTAILLFQYASFLYVVYGRKSRHP